MSARSAASRPALRLSVQFASDDALDGIGRPRLRRWVQAALQVDAVLLLRFVDEPEGRELNARFRGRDSATNVLTFNYETGPPAQADIVVCMPVVRAEAARAGLPFSHHLAHLVVHGTLHAQGHDHQQPEEADAMEDLERRILTGMGIADPYAEAGGAH